MNIHPGKWLVFLLLLLIPPATAVSQDERKIVTQIAFGDYQTNDGADTIIGSQFSLGMQIINSDHWAYFFRLSDGRAEGQHEFTDGSKTVISAATTTLSGGIQYRYSIEMKPELTPYVGVGLSLQNYSYTFDYPDSEIGNTSGIGYGPLLTFGVRINVARHFLIIPNYQFEKIFIKAENGDQKSVTVSGVSLALVLRF